MYELVYWYQGSISSESGEYVRFYYNPATISISKNNRFAQIRAAGREQPILEYGCGGATTVHFSIILRRIPGEDYSTQIITQLREMTKPKIKGAGVDRPPVLTLDLGEAIRLEKCYLTQLKPKLGPLFNPTDLKPYTGEVEVGLTEAKDV